MKDLRFGYGPEYEVYNPQLDFYLQLRSPTRNLKDAFSESRQVARDIAAIIRKPFLCLSGGLDSEAMALAFLAENIPFKAWVIRFEKELNLPDIQHALDFCNEHNIEVQFFDFNVLDFLKSGQALLSTKKYNCFSVEAAAQIECFLQAPDQLVIGGEAFRAFYGESPSFKAISQIEASYIRNLAQSHPHSVANFHFYASELFWSFFKSSIHSKSLSYIDDHTPAYYEDKLSFYRHCGFPLENRPNRTRKLHGFEEVKNYIDAEAEGREHLTYQNLYREPFKRMFAQGPHTRLIFDYQNPYIKDLFVTSS